MLPGEQCMVSTLSQYRSGRLPLEQYAAKGISRSGVDSAFDLNFVRVADL